MRVIAVVNQKGGVGKTTTSVNLGAALARRGRRVLLVDMDPQGNLTDHLLDEPPPGVERLSIYDVIVDGKPLADAIVKTSTEGLSVVPSHQDLAGAELDLASVIGREVLLRDAIESLGDDAYDYVFLDCPPSLGLLSLNALAAAQQVFIALQTEFFAMRGLGALDRTVDLVRRRINPALEVGAIIPTLVDSTRLAREVIDEVRGHYGDKVFLTKIRTNIRLAEAPSHGKHIFDYAPDSPGAADYAQLARELEEGRASVETPADVAAAAAVAGAASAPATAGAPAAVAKPSAPPLRGIAKAIADAAAAVSSGAPAGTRAPVVAKPTIPIPASPAPAAATAAGPASDPKHAAAIAPTAATPAHAATPSATPPATPPPRVPAPSAVPMPVLRPGPRALPLAPLPTRPLSSLPRPSSPAAPATAGSGGRS